MSKCRQVRLVVRALLVVGVALFTSCGSGGSPSVDSSAGTISVQPDRFDFQAVRVGLASPSASFTVTHGLDTADRPVTIATSVGFEQSNDCAQRATAGSCAVAVVFRPASVGFQMGALTAVLGEGVVATAVLLGTGVAPDTIGLRPAQVDFPATSVGQRSEPKIVVLSNEGPAPLTKVMMAVGTADFAIVPELTTCTEEVRPSSECNIALVFTPRSAGLLTTKLAVETAQGARVAIDLSGTAPAM